MKNHRICIFLICIVTMVFMFVFVGCREEGKVYTITYMDRETPKTISVKKGSAFALSTIPTKEGYIFLGLFDSAVEEYN